MKKKSGFHPLYATQCLAAFLLVTACGNHNQVADAFGNFEANEVVVSAQSQGILLFMNATEGNMLEKNAVIGKIDSSVPALKKKQLLAQFKVIAARKHNLEAQLRVQEEQRVNLAREVSRMEKLLGENAATPQQYDDIVGKLKVLNAQTDALRSQQQIIDGEQSGLNAQLEEVNNLLEKCLIFCPLTGTVLEKYAEPGELVSPGKALIKIANLDEMELRVYISGAQLSSVAIGDNADVLIDSIDGSVSSMQGTVSWISSQVEFTPKIIQTREERVNMVYAVKLRVRNDGRLKIGMPGEVRFRD